MAWTRSDQLGLTAGAAEWETDMVVNPRVFDWNGRRFMLYNGNDYGRGGVGDGGARRFFDWLQSATIGPRS